MNLHQPAAPQLLRFRKIRDLGEVVTATLEFLRENYKPLGKAMLFIVGPVVLVTGIIGAGMQVGMMAALVGAGYYGGGNDDYATDYDPVSSLAPFAGVGAVTILVVWAMLLIIITATTAVVYSYIVLYMEREGVQPTVREVWTEAKTHFARLLGTFIALGLIYFVGFFVIAIIPLIGFIAIMVGGPYVAVTMSMVGIIRVREQLPLSDTISRSFDLIRDNWWRTALLLMVIWAVMWAVLSNLAMPQLLLTAVFTMNTVEGEDPSIWLGILTFVMAFLYMFGSFLLYPLPLVAIAFQYFNLVEQKEGVGLRERVEQFGESLEISSAHEESL
jgi:hypothetical protein